jgi:hypothetical protein
MAAHCPARLGYPQMAGHYVLAERYSQADSRLRSPVAMAARCRAVSLADSNLPLRVFPEAPA